MFTDIAVNLTSEQFHSDVDDVIFRASEAKVTRLINLASDLKETLHCIEQASQYESVFATAGVHPHQASSWDDESLDRLRELTKNPNVIAIGECGLDYCRDFSPRPEQRKAFQAQLKLATELNLPAVLHCREAYEDFLPMVARELGSKAVLHCFTGTETELMAALDLGLYIGVTGWICDPKRGEVLRQLVPLIPNDKLLLETDAPYLLPKDLRPKPKSRRNEPSYLPHIASTIAELRGQSLSELANNCQNNVERLFQL